MFRMEGASKTLFRVVLLACCFTLVIGANKVCNSDPIRCAATIDITCNDDVDVCCAQDGAGCFAACCDRQTLNRVKLLAGAIAGALVFIYIVVPIIYCACIGAACFSACCDDRSRTTVVHHNYSPLDPYSTKA
eukprot:m.30672 g.30672  ORF g.30672 m.30672 type:complete len:133 (-) comp9311_c1_seq1:177-575(-)